MQEAERRAAYAADVTYVTNSELGFDYLRDNLAQASIAGNASCTGPASLPVLHAHNAQQSRLADILSQHGWREQATTY